MFGSIHSIDIPTNAKGGWQWKDMVMGWTWRRPLHHRQEIPSIDEGEDNGDVMAKASEQHIRPEEKACDSRPDRGS